MYAMMSSEWKGFARQFLRACGAPARFVAFDLQRRGQLRDRKRILRDYLSRQGPKKLQIGCGKNLLDGWLNTDIYTGQGPDVAYLDATVRFPFDDATFDYVFSEHQIEHIPYPAGLFMLRECCRVLKPGGRIRIATPNLARILAIYTSKPTEEQQHYIKWSVDRHTPQTGIYSPAHVINTFFTSWGHAFIYDPDSLRQSMEQAGFVSVVEYPAEQSDDPHLRGIETHAREIGSKRVNDFETMVLEAARPLVSKTYSDAFHATMSPARATPKPVSAS
jgi:predicted SAM-dependent methyltransferase